jgi:hypothetical protein
MPLAFVLPGPPVISVVDGQEVTEFALKHGVTLVKGDLIGARWVANQIAVERAIEKTGAVRGITFHSRVSSAKDFSSDTSRGIQQWLPDFSVFHVNGTQRSSERKQIIRSFRNATKAVITNARCLTEGIDVTLLKIDHKRTFVPRAALHRGRTVALHGIRYVVVLPLVPWILRY